MYLPDHQLSAAICQTVDILTSPIKYSQRMTPEIETKEAQSFDNLIVELRELMWLTSSRRPGSSLTEGRKLDTSSNELDQKGARESTGNSAKDHEWIRRYQSDCCHRN